MKHLGETLFLMGTGKRRDSCVLEHDVQVFYDQQRERNLALGNQLPHIRFHTGWKIDQHSSGIYELLTETDKEHLSDSEAFFTKIRHRCSRLVVHLCSTSSLLCVCYFRSVVVF